MSMENWKYKQIQDFTAEIVHAAGGNSQFTKSTGDFPQTAIELDLGNGIKLQTAFSADSNAKQVLVILNGLKDIVKEWSMNK